MYKETKKAIRYWFLLLMGGLIIYAGLLSFQNGRMTIPISILIMIVLLHILRSLIIIPVIDLIEQEAWVKKQKLKHGILSLIYVILLCSVSIILFSNDYTLKNTYWVAIISFVMFFVVSFFQGLDLEHMNRYTWRKVLIFPFVMILGIVYIIILSNRTDTNKFMKDIRKPDEIILYSYIEKNLYGLNIDDDCIAITDEKDIDAILDGLVPQHTSQISFIESLNYWRRVHNDRSYQIDFRYSRNSTDDEYDTNIKSIIIGSDNYILIEVINEGLFGPVKLSQEAMSVIDKITHQE